MTLCLLSLLQQAAVGSVHECGLPGNPLSLSWLSGEPQRRSVQGEKAPHVKSAEHQRLPNFSDFYQPTRTPADNISSSSGSGSLQRDSDYESITLMRLRQAEERKRLAQQLAQEES